MLVCPPQVSIIYMASLYLALPSEFDTFVTRCQIYVKVIRWWRRINRNTEANTAAGAYRSLDAEVLRGWRNNWSESGLWALERVAAQKNEIALLRSVLEKMKRCTLK